MSILFVALLFLSADDKSSFLDSYRPAFEKLATAYGRIQMEAIITQYDDKGQFENSTLARCFLFDDFEQLSLGPIDDQIPTYMLNKKGTPETFVRTYFGDQFYWLYKEVNQSEYEYGGQRKTTITKRHPFDKRIRGEFLPISAPFGGYGPLVGEICSSPSFKVVSMQSLKEGEVKVEFEYALAEKRCVRGHWIFDPSRNWVLLEQEVRRYPDGDKPDPFAIITRCTYGTELVDGVPKLTQVEEWFRELATDKETQRSLMTILQLEPLNSTSPFGVENFRIAHLPAK